MVHVAEEEVEEEVVVQRVQMFKMTDLRMMDPAEIIWKIAELLLVMMDLHRMI